MKSFLTGAVGLLLYCVFFLIVVVIGAWRAWRKQPSPFEAEED